MPSVPSVLEPSVPSEPSVLEPCSSQPCSVLGFRFSVLGSRFFWLRPVVFMHTDWSVGKHTDWSVGTVTE